MNALFPTGIGRRKLGKFWFECLDGDDDARAFYDRHYSRTRYADGRDPKLFVGPGEKMVLVTENGDALWAFRKFISDSGETGVNNAIFRNEGDVLSSELILDAELVGWSRWPGQRFYTYVDPKKIRSSNQGACYQIAGWRRCGITKKRKRLIFEKLPL